MWTNFDSMEMAHTTKGKGCVTHYRRFIWIGEKYASLFPLIPFIVMPLLSVDRNCVQWCGEKIENVSFCVQWLYLSTESRLCGQMYFKKHLLCPKLSQVAALLYCALISHQNCMLLCHHFQQTSSALSNAIFIKYFWRLCWNSPLKTE